MKIAVLDKSGQKTKEVEIPAVFDIQISDKALALYINYLHSALRAPVANTKDRGQVSGGGRKPWKQKGTGNARAGSIRSPLWVGGGVTFGPTDERNYRLRLSQTGRKNAVLGIFNRLFEAQRVSIIDELAFDKPKTSVAVEIMKSLKVEGKVAVILSGKSRNAPESFRNIAGVNVMAPGRLNMVGLLTSDNIIMAESAIEELKNIYDKNNRPAGGPSKPQTTGNGLPEAANE